MGFLDRKILLGFGVSTLIYLISIAVYVYVVKLKSDLVVQYTISPSGTFVPSNCSRYAFVPFRIGAGAGHHVADYVFSIALAIAVHGNVAFEASNKFDYDGKHGNTSWIVKFLNMDDGDAYVGDLLQHGYKMVDVESWSGAIHQSKFACNAIFRVRDDQCDAAYGGTGDCFSELKGAYESAKWILREKFSRTTFRPKSYRFSSSFFNVAWHLRTGDKKLHGKDVRFFKTVLMQVSSALEGFPVRHYFFYEGHRLPHEFEFLKDLGVPNATFVSGMDPGETMFHFVNANMLVGTGSSFAITAQLVSWKTIFLHTEPKEGGFYGVYETSEVVRVTRDGMILDSRAALRARATLAWKRYGSTVIP